ncbi:MAG TPA: hypothetical protein VHY30_09715 [Verrucomicrobiae bacterium]|jgi:hypothetical protein|nr:hypothetical protein [Verrucomicrobiae bacterium]
MNQANDSDRGFAAWLLAIFLVALGAQLWVVWLYGSPIPFWDQWDESISLFKPWVEDHLTWPDVFAPASDHRIVVTHLLDLSLIWLNGRWDPLLQMTVNAFFHATFACGLAFCLWHFLGRKNGWLVCFLLLPFFALPYAGENAIWGMNSLWYFVSLFGLVTIAGLGFCRAGSWRWWLGLAAAILGLLSIASGPIAPMAVGGLIFLRGIKTRRLAKENLLSLGVCLLLVGGGMALRTNAAGYRPLQAHSWAEFTSALVRNLDWPFFKLPEMACVIALPLVLLLVYYLRPNFSAPRAAELLLTLALWSAFQSVVIAFGRANYGEDVPASRYMDVFSIFVIASLFATVLLGELWRSKLFPNCNEMLLPLIFAGVIFFGLDRMSQIVVDNLLVPTRQMNLIAEERVTTFMATGDERDFFESPTVRPNPETALSVLKNAKLQTILPVACFPPAASPATGRLTTVSQWLLRHSIVILSCGLILFVGLCGLGLARGTMDLNMKNPAGVLALLTGLAALGFVWEKRLLQRGSVEYGMQQQLAADFKSAGNFKRAAIHEHKAEELKPIK